ncbi:sugar O-acetyltransferase [uncultured Methanobrevibacter sp.]|uniref:sugar O-acetyltransferase n=1 Tax=uncultured Methanobrevibacter sp. TaxID=253161 RepID=UPI00263645A6|nr:sugar O-acetyltransferase [uncultured Methanobrevibacter sp.]
MQSELEKLKAGLDYCYDDPEVEALKNNAIINCRKYNSIDDLDKQKQYKFLKFMLGSVGEDVCIEKRFNCDNGKNIYIGSHFLANYNLTILDVVDVKIGNYVLIGPNTLITTVGHPISPKGRRNKIGTTAPITIGDDVWIGGNVTILPGVTIGNNVVIGAGAVVSKDIPDNSLAVGVPARVIKEIKNDLYGI